MLATNCTGFTVNGSLLPKNAQVDPTGCDEGSSELDANSLAIAAVLSDRCSHKSVTVNCELLRCEYSLGRSLFTVQVLRLPRLFQKVCHNQRGHSLEKVSTRYTNFSDPRQ